jgi:aminoglycoside phosphotransferase (APT) family kinase protein
LEETIQWLEKNKPDASSDQYSIVWGDCRVPNIMYKSDGEVSGVLDWEMVALGDPCQDLAWGIAIDDCNSDGINIPKLDGMPSKDETIMKWEELSGFHAENFNYYYIFSIFKFAVIMIRVVKKLEYYEIMPPGLNAHIDNHASQMLAKVLKEI